MPPPAFRESVNDAAKNLLACARKLIGDHDPIASMVYGDGTLYISVRNEVIHQAEYEKILRSAARCRQQFNHRTCAKIESRLFHFS